MDLKKEEIYFYCLIWALKKGEKNKDFFQSLNGPWHCIGGKKDDVLLKKEISKEFKIFVIPSEIQIQQLSKSFFS